MRERAFAYRRDLAPELNLVRLRRWIRTYGGGVRPMGKMERAIRCLAAFKKPGGRRTVFRALGVAA